MSRRSVPTAVAVAMTLGTDSQYTGGDDSGVVVMVMMLLVVVLVVVVVMVVVWSLW